jgi:hypothetical protein
MALFASLGGGAYAALGGPGGHTRVFVGCVDRSSGVLRVVPTAQSCRRARTINRGGRHVRLPGEYAIAWNQTGPQGIPGGNGQRGLPGPQGPAGPFPSTLPSGKTLTGAYRTDIVNMVALEDTQSFAYPLASRPSVHFIGIGTTAPAQCPGTASDPQAAPGNLCVYAALGLSGANVIGISDPDTNHPGSSLWGFTVAGATSSGSWAVTAPQPRVVMSRLGIAGRRPNRRVSPPHPNNPGPRRARSPRGP